MSRESRQDPDKLQLVRKAQTGDVAAYEQLYRQHVSGVYGLCLRLVADPVQAEILTQDVFVRAWQKLGTYQGRGDFGGWLHRITVNVVREDRRREARWARMTRSVPGVESREGDQQDMASQMAMKEKYEGTVTPPEAMAERIDLDRAIAALPLGARLAFVLHDVMGYPQAEIASMTDSALGTVKAQVHRARSLLRKALAEGPGPEDLAKRRKSSR